MNGYELISQAFEKEKVMFYVPWDLIVWMVSGLIIYVLTALTAQSLGMPNNEATALVAMVVAALINTAVVFMAIVLAEFASSFWRKLFSA